MRHLTWVAERLFNVPLLIESGKLDVIQHVLSPRLGVDAPNVPESRLQEADKREIYSVTPSGIAVIDISGTLVNRLPSGVDAMSGLTSYEQISSELDKAEADTAVGGVMLRVNSGGGEAAGTVSLADKITKFSKPVWASVDTNAFSAAYWLASAADKMFLPIDGGVGSIGVIARHVDQSEMHKAAGIKVTTVKAGARKADFSQFDPLSEEAHARLQSQVDDIYGMFVDSVAKNRQMAKKAVRATEATTIYGQAGIEAGLADKIGTFSEAIAEMESMLSRGGKREAPAVITEKKSESRKERAFEERYASILELRAPANLATNDEPIITGHVAVFNQYSLDCGGFQERILPGAFAKTIQENDIHQFFNHDGNIVLGRVKSGTLRLKEDGIGLHVENDPPNTQTVRDLVLEPIRRGDIDQGSFMFLPTRQKWDQIDGKLTRTLHEVRLFHTSILPCGAYPQTDVALRALATATGIDFEALAVAMAKVTHNLDLSNEEKSLLKDAIRQLTLENPVTPGHAAHLTESETKPPALTETLRYRLEILRRRVVA